MGNTDKLDHEDKIPMSPLHFKITIDWMKFADDSPVVLAAALVLCENWKAVDAAKKYGVQDTQVNRAVGDIKQKWQELYEKQDMQCEYVVFPREEMAAIRALEKRSRDLLSKKK